MFYKQMDDKVLNIFGPTIHENWNCQNSNLKKELVVYLEYLFKVDTFNKTGVTTTVKKTLKYVRDQHRVYLGDSPNYELPPMILKKAPPCEARYRLHLAFNMFIFLSF